MILEVLTPNKTTIDLTCVSNLSSFVDWGRKGEKGSVHAAGKIVRVQLHLCEQCTHVPTIHVSGTCVRKLTH